MNLKSMITNELWLSISNPYEAENYYHAILDSIHHIYQLIRDKSGLDSDGSQLIGAAFGGRNPSLKLNKLQTETEKNIQSGIEQILRGIHQAIRNPRSHEKIDDTKNTADAIILFVNYLEGIIDQSQERFTYENFFIRVFDPYFVNRNKYCEIVVNDIPQRKLLETLIRLFRRKKEGDGNNVASIAKEIIKKLSHDQLLEFLAIVSEELKYTKDNIDIRITLQILPPEYWKEIEISARMRIENIIIKSIKEGKANGNGKIIDGKGALGTWACDFVQYFYSIGEATYTILNKLKNNSEEQLFVYHFFFNILPTIMISEYYIKACLKPICDYSKVGGNEYSQDFGSILEENFWSLPDNWKGFIEQEYPEIAKGFNNLPF